MKRNAVLAVILSLCMLFTACAAKSSPTSSRKDTAYSGTGATAAENGAAEEYSVAAEPSEAADTAQTTGALAEKPQDADVRKIVYTADMAVTADDPAEVLELLIGKTESLGGYVAGSYTENDELGARRSTASLKVPADKLETLVAAAEAAGKVDSYQLSSDDISLSYYDVQARLKSAEAEEQQLLEILKQCKTIEEILAVRESLAEVRSNIESYRGQINLWDNLVSYATLQLTVNRTQRAAVEGEGELITLWKASDVGKKMSLGFQNSVRFVANALGAIGIFLAYAILPAALIFGVVFGIRALARATAEKRRARKERKRLKKEARRAAKMVKKE